LGLKPRPSRTASINLDVLPARQFLQANTVKTIAQIFAETGLAPDALEIEITESIAMTDVNFTVSILQQLQQMGIQISLDDFGTGYSSLWSLKLLPLNNLKIDRSFVSDLMDGSNGATIVKVAIALGQGMNLQVIAEGVETIEQLEFLQSLKCDMAQGYLFSKPIPAAAATQLCIGNREWKIGSFPQQLEEVRQRIRSTDVTDVSKEDEGSSATDSVMDVTDVSKEDEGSSAEDTAVPCPSRVLTVGNINSDATGFDFTAKQTLSLRILASQSKYCHRQIQDHNFPSIRAKFR
jgi:EAL domain